MKTFQKFYSFLFVASPWVFLAGLFQYNFQKFIRVPRIFEGPYTFDYFTIIDIFVVFLCLVFVVGFLRRKIAVSLKKVPAEFWLAVGLLLVAGLLQIFFQDSFAPILSTPYKYFRSLFLFPLLFVFLALSTTEEKTFQKVARSYVAMVAFFSLLALTQYLFGIFPGEQYDFTRRLVWPFVDFVTLKSSSANWAAFFVMPALILSFAKVFQAFLTGKIAKDLALYNTTFLLSAAVLYLTQSYGAYVAVFVAILLYLFKSLKFKHFIPALLVMVMLAGGSYLHQSNSYKYKILTGQIPYRYDTSVAGREEIMKMNLHIITSHPWLGVGLNQYQSYFAQKQQEVLGHEYKESHIPPHAHNFFLSFWTNLGVFGVLGILILVLGIFKRFGLSVDNPALYVLVAIMIHGLIDSYYWRQEIAYTFWLVVSFAYLFRVSPKGESR